MKTKLHSLIAFLALSAGAFAADWQADDARLLKKYVAGDGAVRSKIFDWSKEDCGGAPAVAVFLKKDRRGKSDFKKIGCQDYDWCSTKRSK